MLQLPTSYFLKCLGKHLKYSSCLWPNEDTTLDEAEEAMLGALPFVLTCFDTSTLKGTPARRAALCCVHIAAADWQHVARSGMWLPSHLGCTSHRCSTSVPTRRGSDARPAELYCERAQLADGQDVLELGCGWGSLCLYVAAKYPKSRVTAVSNSNSQRELISSIAAKRGIGNLTVITANLVDFQPPKSRLTGGSTYDRVVTVECLEHMKNYQVGTDGRTVLRQVLPQRSCELVASILQY